uniref:Activity-regulated cytoskeleton associated protein 1-like n=1 Tax=Diabrotica virgifera virgifera TaxID=50390 RepID=A0A6P7H3E9_DIAVI
MSKANSKNPAAGECSAPAMVTMSQDLFDLLLSVLANYNKQVSEDILVQIRDLNRTPTHTSGGNFVKCTARFDGTVNADVEAFLDNVITFKDCSQISDENALRGLSMLLNGSAATWWQGVKNTILTWEDAVQALRDAYSRKLPPHLIFRELFSREQ